MMSENKVKYNLRNVHYAELDELTGTYKTPIKMPGAVSLALSPVGDTVSFYADGIEYFTSNSNGGYQGELEIAKLPESFETTILGEEITKTDKVQVEKTDVPTKPFALLFEFEGDQKAIKHLIFNTKATRINIESKTTTQSKEPVPEKLSVKCVPDSKGRVKAKTNSQTVQAVVDSWYTKVWEKDSAVV